MEYAFRKSLIRVLLVISALALIANMAWAQAGAGELTGIITDPQGAVVSNVTVTLTNASTGAKRTSITTSAGNYRFSALPIVGAYTVEVAPSGFRSVKIDNVIVSVGVTTTRDIKLEVGTSNEQVTVEAGAQQIQTTESAVSQLLDRRVWESMPLETRSQNEFINLIAGAEPQAFNDTGRGASVNGTRSGTGNYLVEGADNNEQGQGGVALEGAGGANTTISPDAIQEYRVITNDFPAEYGKAGGFVTDTVLKSGVNKFHGSAFEYNRIQALAANDYFSNKSEQRDHLVRNQFGGSLGGPIIKDKMFFYGTGEIHRLRQSTPTTATGTTQDFLNFVDSGQFENFIENDPSGYCVVDLGAPCPGAFPHSASLGPIFKQLQAAEPGAFPLAPTTQTCNPAAGGNNPGGCLAQGVLTGTAFGFAQLAYPVQVYGTVTKPVAATTDQSRFSVKYDYKVSEKDQLNFVYLFDDVQFQDNNSAAASSIGVGEVVPSRAQNGSISWNRTLSSSILNQARFAYLRRVANFTAPGTEGVPNIATFLDPLGTSFGSTAGIPQFFTENQFQYKDDLSITKGSHNMKVGGEYRRTRNGSSFFNDSKGTADPWSIEDLVTDLTFDDEADAVTFGEPVTGGCALCSASINPTTGNLPVYYRGYRANEFAAYVQDDWRIKPRLTLNLGVRWEYFGPPHNFLPDTDSNFYFGTTGTPLPATSNPFFPAAVPYYEKVGTGSFQVRDQLWNKDTNNFGPRIGFAWDAFGTGKVVIRGGYAVAYDRIYNNLFENIRFNPPFFSDATFGFFGNGVPAGGLSTPGFYAVPFTANQTGYLLDPAIFPNGLPKASPRHMDQNLVSPYYQQIHFGMQTELARDLVLETNFIGTLGKKLTGILNNNTFDGRLACSAAPYDPGTPCADAGFADGFSTGRPNTTIGSDNFRTNAFSSSYYGWQTSLNKRYSMGLQLNASYTFSKTLDQLSDAFRPKVTGGSAPQPTDSSNVHLDYGPADFDARNRIVSSFNYDLPFMKKNRWLGGWTFNGVFSWQTGVPVPIWDGNNDLNEDGVLNDRPVYAAGFSAANATLKNSNPADGFLNPNAFATASCSPDQNLGLWCNSPMHRNDVYGPHFIDLDFGAGKTFKITESAKITLMANFFNLANHPNMDTPEGNVSDLNNFGKSLATLGDNGGHRTTQLAIRFDF